MQSNLLLQHEVASSLTLTLTPGTDSKVHVNINIYNDYYNGFNTNWIWIFCNGIDCVFESYDIYKLASNLSINYCTKESWLMNYVFFMNTCSYNANFLVF